MIYFIGAGPGDPELITVKGKRLIDEADIIIYAGSLVNPQVLSGARPEAEIYNSATMNLEEVLDVMKRGVAAGKKVSASIPKIRLVTAPTGNRWWNWKKWEFLMRSCRESVPSWRLQPA